MSADINADGSNSTILFRIDGENDSNVKFRLKSDNEHEMTGSFNLSDNLTLGGRVLGDMRVTGDVIAETYIVSSSVTYLTQSFASGSHIFGDTLDDRHEFTGSLDISGSITPGKDDTFDLGTFKNKLDDNFYSIRKIKDREIDQ